MPEEQYVTLVSRSVHPPNHPTPPQRNPTPRNELIQITAAWIGGWRASDDSLTTFSWITRVNRWSGCSLQLIISGSQSDLHGASQQVIQRLFTSFSPSRPFAFLLNCLSTKNCFRQNCFWQKLHATNLASTIALLGNLLLHFLFLLPAGQPHLSPDAGVPEQTASPPKPPHPISPVSPAPADRPGSLAWAASLATRPGLLIMPAVDLRIYKL